MNILVEQGGYPLLNMGDCSMLKASLDRLRKHFPNANISIVTASPERLAKLFPSGTALMKSGSNIWFSSTFRIPKVGRKDQTTLSNFEFNLRKNKPKLLKKIIDIKLSILSRAEEKRNLDLFYKSFYEADVIISLGGGYINDLFKYDALRILNTLDLASQLGKPTFLMGQGLGPLNDKVLLDKTKSTLQKLNLITLRERIVALPLLDSFGISEDQFIVTGDDAVELANHSSPVGLGNSIGVNLRIAPYSGIDDETVDNIRKILHSAAKKYSSNLLPIPIETAYFEGLVDPDSTTIKKLLVGMDDCSDGGKNLDTPQKVIEQVGHCRIVVTGSYHAGVFALAQGIPVIGLAKSQYYADKFLGLADQFGSGCEVVMLLNNDLDEELSTQISKLWENASYIRPQLLSAAQTQIEQGQLAYEKLKLFAAAAA